MAGETAGHGPIFAFAVEAGKAGRQACKDGWTMGVEKSGKGAYPRFSAVAFF